MAFWKKRARISSDERNQSSSLPKLWVISKASQISV
jgi:hypothetical protein